MSLPFSERPAPLLADSRRSDAGARLTQAADRAEFLLRASRTVSALQQPQRALEALTELLLDRLVEVAQIVVRTGTAALTCSGTSGGPVRFTSHRLSRASPVGVEAAITHGTPKDVSLPHRGGK